MEFVLRDFHQQRNLRRYVFDGISADRKRQPFAVDVDLTLVHKYAIPLQELPLLCRRLLEGSIQAHSSVALVFAETEMLNYANRRAAVLREAEEKRKMHHRPPVPSSSMKGWRSS
jgi:hypothetical protein